jgi:hypothetical protein
MEACDVLVFLLEDLETSRERIGYLQIVVVGLVASAQFVFIERGFHLPDRRDHPLRFVDHLFLLLCNNADLVM